MLLGCTPVHILLPDQCILVFLPYMAGSPDHPGVCRMKDAYQRKKLVVGSGWDYKDSATEGRCYVHRQGYAGIAYNPDCFARNRTVVHAGEAENTQARTEVEQSKLVGQSVGVHHGYQTGYRFLNGC